MRERFLFSPSVAFSDCKQEREGSVCGRELEKKPRVFIEHVKERKRVTTRNRERKNIINI